MSFSSLGWSIISVKTTLARSWSIVDCYANRVVVIELLGCRRSSEGRMPTCERVWLAFVGVLLIVVSGAATGIAHAQSGSEPPGVMVGRIEAPIDAVSARILNGWIESAESRNAALFVLEIDTPGGSFDSTREMVGAILESSVPIAVYVGPSGARAASAGTFIVTAGHIAAMAPGTNIGASSPVSGSGDDLPETLKAKVTQDAAAFLREIATLRERNSDALERTVFEAVSYSSSEAIELGIVNLVAEDVVDLVRLTEGRRVMVAGSEQVLETAGAAIERVDPTPVQRFLRWISNPHLVFIMLAAGGILIIVEWFSPGGWIPGITGVSLLILAFLGLGNLPVNWVGLALIAVGIGLIVFELHAPGWGGFGAAGAISFLAGGFLLFGDSSIPGLPAPSIRVSYAVLGVTAGLLGISVSSLWYFARKTRDIRVESRSSQLIGEVGVVHTALDPTGTVQVANELWTADSDSGETIHSGESVVVSEVDGVKLKVFKESAI